MQPGVNYEKKKKQIYQSGRMLVEKKAVEDYLIQCEQKEHFYK